MFRLPVWCAVVVTAAVIGSAASAALASTPPPPSKANLTARLLTAKELGKGWSRTSSAGFDSGLPKCLETIYTKAADQHAVANRSFLDGNIQHPTATYQDRLVSFTNGKASTRTATFERSVASCKKKAGGGVTVTVKAIRFRAVGQQSKAFFVTLKSHNQLVHAVIVLARQRATVVVSTYAEETTQTVKGKHFATMAIKKAA